MDWITGRELKNCCGIYKIQSVIKPERIYIGSAKNIRIRWNIHTSNLKLNRHENKKLQNHYNKYGVNDLKLYKMIDFIQGQKFIEIADFTYSPRVKLSDDYDNLANTLDLSLLKERNIVYTHIGYAPQLFDFIRSSDKKFIVVTHSCDRRIEEQGIVTPNGSGGIVGVEKFVIPDNVIKWYSKNVNVVDSRIESIPIGLENDRWFKNLHKKEKMIQKLKQPRKIKNLVYMNHNIATNPAKRTEPYQLLKDKPWVTTDMGTNGSRFDEYLDNIYNHKFVICPEGNGIDTHRLWECLYMGTIPIVEDSVSAELLYSYFPCLITHDGWNGIDDISLNWEFKILTEIKITTDIHNKMLTFEYWKNKIINTL
jgi:predicted DNA-binding protein (MmcQ/YjbR family)